ncbi:Cys-tRNA(Pro) deacylase [Wansuia hejianensis]|uniref:Cys-tRNA(Pro)/Cys-tRNA(Cys) deacylase n=1 Tax=Wansuia hejianensis TaxID=2763667 RepID=A0A926F0Y4_9FIRM|nr:Cys-tRNA(Pro) deacylase [Wansuia hejianensis]MBC8591351.1 Cys-tRNA(Pro) deacylase [Wansuia hejianensis]
MSKTNAMRILDKQKIPYNMYSYDPKDGLIDGISVAKKIGKDVKEVYKTLVGKGKHQVYVFIISVDKELDLKKAAEVANEKKIELVHVKDIMKLTGYIRGGCSPIGMKKLYPSFIQEDSLNLENIIVSAGKIGLQIQLDPKDLANEIQGKFVDIIK